MKKNEYKGFLEYSVISSKMTVHRQYIIKLNQNNMLNFINANELLETLIKYMV